MLFALPAGPSECICWKEQITSTGTISCFFFSHTRRIELRTSYQSDFLSCRMISSLQRSCYEVWYKGGGVKGGGERTKTEYYRLMKVGVENK